MEHSAETNNEDEFEELLKKTAQAIRSANYRVKDVLNRRGSLKCGEGFILMSDIKSLLQDLHKVWMLYKE